MRTAHDLMTRDVITVNPETPLLKAANILLSKKFNGLPVVDGDNKVVGILTEYDLILKGTAIHLPTFLKIFQDLELYKKGSELVRGDLKKIFTMKVSEVMNNDPLLVAEDTSIIEIAYIFTQHHKVNPVPVVDKENKLVGIISRHDLLKFLGDTSDKQISDDVDKNIDNFLSNYENKFELVSKSRARSWLIASVLFAVVGFLIAWFLILRLI